MGVNRPEPIPHPLPVLLAVYTADSMVCPSAPRIDSLPGVAKEKTVKHSNDDHLERTAHQQGSHQRWATAGQALMPLLVS